MPSYRRKAWALENLKNKPTIFFNISNFSKKHFFPAIFDIPCSVSNKFDQQHQTCRKNHKICLKKTFKKIYKKIQISDLNKKKILVIILFFFKRDMPCI